MDLGEENQDQKAEQPDGGDEGDDNDGEKPSKADRVNNNNNNSSSNGSNNKMPRKMDASRKGRKQPQGNLTLTARQESRSRSRSRTRKASISSPSKSWKSANAWLNFMQDFRANLRGIRGMRNPSIFRLASERWSEMTPEEKKPYVDAANRVKRQKHLESRVNGARNNARLVERRRGGGKSGAALSRKSNKKRKNEGDAETTNGSDSEYDSGERNGKSRKNLDSDDPSSVDTD